MLRSTFQHTTEDQQTITIADGYSTSVLQNGNAILQIVTQTLSFLLSCTDFQR